MSTQRLTITLSAARHAALKQAAAARGRTIGQLIDESLEHYGIRSDDEALALVRQARAAAGLSEAEALALADAEVQAQRAGR